MAAKAFLFLLIAVTVTMLGSDAMYLKRTSYPKPLPGERLEQFMLRARESLPRLSYAEDEKRNNLRLPFENDKRSEPLPGERLEQFMLRSRESLPRLSYAEDEKRECIDEYGTAYCEIFIKDPEDVLIYCNPYSNTFVSHANFIKFTQTACKASCGNCHKANSRG